MDWQVRQLGPDDAAAFQALRLEALATDPCAFAASHDEEAGQSLDDVAARLERQPVFGAFSDGVLLGVAGFAVPAPAKKRHKGLLWGVYVREAARDRGLGPRRGTRVIEHARAHVLQMHAAVVTTNYAARRLYRSLGFTPYGLEPRGLACAGRYYDQELLVLMLDDEIQPEKTRSSYVDHADHEGIDAGPQARGSPSVDRYERYQWSGVTRRQPTRSAGPIKTVIMGAEPSQCQWAVGGVSLPVRSTR